VLSHQPSTPVRAAARAERKFFVIIWHGRNTMVALPDRDKDLGELKPGQLIVTLERREPPGLNSMRSP
jgi:hypothetical protein